MRLQVTDLCYAYGQKKAADHVSLHVDAGEFVGLLGPNADESITVTLYDYYDVLTTITGTGTGTMTATVEFEDEDGTTATRTFSQVPIAEDTLITFRGFNLNSGTMLVLYKDYGDTFVEVWYADGNQTVQSADEGITEEFLAEMTFSGDEEETPTRRPTSTVTTQTATTHRVTAPEIANGSILVNPARPEAGDKVTLTVTPDTGYQLDTLTVTDGSGKTVQLTEQKDGTYTFIMPDGDVTVDAAFKLITGTLVQGIIATLFTDISGSRFKDAIAYCYANGIMNGVSATAFDPEGTLTRAMVVTTLYRVAGEPAVSGTNVFTDVADGQWYTDAVRWAAQNGVVEGYGDGRFGPNDPVTREQLAAILYRYANACGYYTGSTYPLDGFSDSAAVSAYAVEALEWAVANGTIVSRTVGVLDAGQSATRAEVAQALMVFCQSVVK